MAAPLEGIRVVDTTRLLPGGFCSMLLSDLGAHVIKVEQPGLGDYMRLTPPLEGVSMVHTMVNRNKRSIGLNLKTEEGKKILEKLVRRSDVFLEGFRPGAMARLGFSFRRVKDINTKIVYCSISAFGQGSPMSNMPGHDLNFQALAGTLGSTKEAQVPFVQYADLVAGLYATIGILGALQRRPREAVHVPIVQSLMSLLLLPASAYFTTGKRNRAKASLVLGSEAFYSLYKTSDAKYMAVAAIEAEFWGKLLRRLDLSSMEARRDGGKKERREATRTFQRAFAKRTRDEWTKLLMNSETCTTPVLDIEEALDSEWSNVLGGENSGGMYLGFPVTFEPSGKVMRSAAPTLGQHTREILAELGVPKHMVDLLESEGAVST
jgi:crotonobetainyl-CoA:carnitine CoA-transferase CaiB-like acyl-CoA transferase